MWNCFGCVCICPNMGYSFFQLIGTSIAAPSFLDWCNELPSTMMISPIFPGFDRALHVQPNYVQVGPILDPDLSQTLNRLERANKELFDWMNEAMQNGEDIIYVTMGSEVPW